VARPDPRPRRDLLGRAIAAVPAVSLLLWWRSLVGIDLGQMNDSGLISVLPASYFVALAALLVAFLFELQRPTPRVAVIGFMIGALVAIRVDGSVDRDLSELVWSARCGGLSQQHHRG
jgi:hypothetical protein